MWTSHLNLVLRMKTSRAVLTLPRVPSCLLGTHKDQFVAVCFVHQPRHCMVRSTIHCVFWGEQKGQCFGRLWHASLRLCTGSSVTTERRIIFFLLMSTRYFSSVSSSEVLWCTFSEKVEFLTSSSSEMTCRFVRI